MIATLLTWMEASVSMMPPVWLPRALCACLVCFLIRLAPSTSTRSSLGYATMTLPRSPRSLPVSTWTVSPFLIFMSSDHFRCQRDDPHELAIAQLAAHRAKNASAARVAGVTDQHRCVFVEFDVRAIGTAPLLDGADDDRLDDLALLHAGAGQRVLHGADDDVADPRVATAGAAEHANAEQLLGAGVVGDAQPRLLLDHRARSRISTTRQRLVADSGRVSMSSTRSPTAASP